MRPKTPKHGSIRPRPVHDPKRLAAVAALPCVAKGCGRPGPSTVHHTGTHLGGGRCDTRIIPLCWNHHLGPEGIDGKRMGKRVWEKRFGTEEDLLAKTDETLRIMKCETMH